MRSLLFAVLVVGCGAGYQFDLGAIGAACGVAAITLGLAWNYDYAQR
jgi:hypothetical protein